MNYRPTFDPDNPANPFPAPIEPPVAFNLDLANGKTNDRFCYAAALVLDETIDQDVEDALGFGSDDEFADEVADEWEAKLFAAGYYVRWDAGDVVVWDLRGLSDEDRERFYEQMQDA
jgi:hypothetical protein